MLRTSTRVLAASTAVVGAALLLLLVVPYREDFAPLELLLFAPAFFTVASTAATTVEATMVCFSPARYTRQSGLIAATSMSVGMLLICLVQDIAEPAPSWNGSIMGAHYVLPGMAALLGLLVIRDCPFHARPRLLSTAMPALYLAYTLLHGAVTGRYPYWWANVPRVGMGVLLAHSVGFGAIIYLLMGLCWNRVLRLGAAPASDGTGPARRSRSRLRPSPYMTWRADRATGLPSR